MARQNIQFKGLRHSPSDITGQDGDLLECVNLIHENGELKPIEMPEKTYLKGVYSNETLVAVHNLTDGKKFVFAVWNTVTTTIHVKDANNTVVFTRGIPMEEIQWAETIGNTLIIGTDKSTHYAFYKNGAYKWLGDKLPQPVFEFDFNRTNNEQLGYWLKEYDPKTTTLTPSGDNAAGGGVAMQATWTSDSNLSNSESIPLANTSVESKKLFRDGVRSHIATVLSNARKNNVFVFPFMVRYAIRMFDGNYAMHSAPLLMVPSTLKCPLLAVMGYSADHWLDDSDNVHKYSVMTEEVRFRALELLLKCNGFIDGDPSEWEDIIKGVDIFMSSPIYSYNESYWDDINHVPDSFYTFKKTISNGAGFVEDTTVKDYGNCYSKNSKFSWWRIFTENSVDAFDYDATIQPDETDYPVLKYRRIPLPEYSQQEMINQIKNTSLFFRVKHYDLHEVSEAWTAERRFGQEVEYGLLDRLETLPTLPDDYVSRSRMTGSVNYNYNQRLILGNIKLQAPLWYQDAKRFKAPDVFYFDLYFIVEKSEKTIVVRWNSNDGSHYNDIGLFDFGHYIYYPDPDCKRVVIEVGNNKKVLPMHEHTGLNGAYALMPDLKSLNEALSGLEDWMGDLPEPSQDRYCQMPNTIAMSSVANPFHFPATNFKDIGRTKVVGIAANTLDVSSGQWGQYPLYVFCSDGIIAVMIDGEGKFGGIQAVSADVLREPRGLSQPTLVQTGQALMFLTQRGVMAIAGTQINCLSEAMNGRHFNPMRELADVDYHVGAFANLIGRTSDDTDFRDFAASGFLAYDYAHHRVLLLNPNFDYQYVYSMNTGMWSKQIIYTNLDSFQVEVVPGNELPAQRSSGVPLLKVKPIRDAVNNYTEMYLQDDDGWLYKTMEVQGENSVKQLYQYGYLVSRPIRFGTDEYKTLTRVLHRYTNYASMSFVKMALYGSRDGVKYGRINTLRGMSYQYFIFVVYTYLKPNERYSYLTVDFETRLTNKLR